MDKTPKILGIVGIVLGSLASLTSVFGLVAQPLLKRAMAAFSSWADRLPAQPGQPRMGEVMEKTAEVMEATRPYQTAQSLGMLLLSAALIVFCVAMVQRRPWARSAAMGWAVAALCFIPVMIWIQAFVIQPMTQESVLQSMQVPHGNPRQLETQRQVFGYMRSFQAASAAVGTLSFYAPFPILLLALLRREKSKSWFAPAPRDPGPAAP